MTAPDQTLDSPLEKTVVTTTWVCCVSHGFVFHCHSCSCHFFLALKNLKSPMQSTCLCNCDTPTVCARFHVRNRIEGGSGQVLCSVRSVDNVVRPSQVRSTRAQLASVSLWTVLSPAEAATAVFGQKETQTCTASDFGTPLVKRVDTPRSQNPLSAHSDAKDPQFNASFHVGHKLNLLIGFAQITTFFTANIFQMRSQVLHGAPPLLPSGLA